MARTFDRSQLALPVLVALIGIVGSFAVYSSSRSAEGLIATQRLSDAGQELDRVSADLQAVAIQQVLAIQGLYEASSTVTEEEFRHFVDIIAGPTDNQLGYAHMVSQDVLYDFLMATRLTRPNFIFQRQQPLKGGDYWPLLHSSESGGVRYPAGFDFGSDRTIRQAIETSFAENRAVAATFIDIPGDDRTADFVLVAPIRRSGQPVGLAVVTLHLEELLRGRSEQILGNTAHLSLSLAAQPLAPSSRSTGSSWVSTVLVVGEPIRLVLEVPDGPAPSAFARWLLLLGVAMSFLVGGLIYERAHRSAMALRLTDLEASLAGKDRFLAGVSHELRTPLTVVVGMIETLADRADSFNEENRGLIQDVRSSAQELASLVEDHLTFARLNAGALTVEHEPVDLDLVVASALLGTYCPAGLTVIVGQLGTCTGDSIRIRQIVRNLIRNAYRFAVSSIEIRPSSTDLAGLEIVNDGAPVPAHLVESLFEPLVERSRPGQPEGIGLGLSVSRRLARRMGGDLSYSFVDGDVKFCLSLQPAGGINSLANYEEMSLVSPTTASMFK